MSHHNMFFQTKINTAISAMGWTCTKKATAIAEREISNLHKKWWVSYCTYTRYSTTVRQIRTATAFANRDVCKRPSFYSWSNNSMEIELPNEIFMFSRLRSRMEIGCTLYTQPYPCLLNSSRPCQPYYVPSLFNRGLLLPLLTVLSS